MVVRYPKVLVATALLLAACDAGGSTLSTTTTVTTTATTTSTIPATTTTAVVVVDALALPLAGEMGPEWVEELFIPYGDTPETLGTSPGGEGGSMDLGPEFGAQGPDGTWWFLDAAKTRLARYAADGTFLDAVPLPEEVLVGGVYFQFQVPRVLADGTLVAFGYRETTTAVLRATGDGVDQIFLDSLVLPRVDDGSLAYGFADSGGLAAVDPLAGTVTPVEWFVTQTGARYRFEVTEAGLRIELPDAPTTPVDRVLPLVTAADPTIGAFGSIEVTSTADGRIHLLVIGASEADEMTPLAGYATILPDGTVTPMIPVRDPVTLSDPGSPAHLGAAFGSSEAWLMFIDTDGVRVFRRAG